MIFKSNKFSILSFTCMLNFLLYYGQNSFYMYINDNK